MQAKNMSMSPEFSGFLDFVRWVAALLVVLHHWRHLWFSDLADVTNKTLLIRVFYFFTGFGTEAVMVFFVLSGFLVGGGALRKFRTRSYSPLDYMISRFSRIYTVLVPALILGGLLDWIGLQYFNSTEIYTNAPRYHTKSLGFVITDNLNIMTFLSNLFDLQGILTKHFGSNIPLWSLSFEWWFYCLFALILDIITRRYTDLIFWLSGLVGVILILVFPIKLSLYFLIWLLGVSVASIDSNRFRFNPYVSLIIFVLLSAGSRLSRILFDAHQNDPVYFYLGFIEDFIVAMGFAALILSVRSTQKTVPGSLAFHKVMADFSFTIYLLHVPLLVFITAILSSNFGVPFFVQPTLQHFLISGLILLLIYVILFIYSQFTERFTPNVKNYLTRTIISIRKVS